MARRYYLPECHDFEYIARAPWPNYDSQLDWVDNVIVLETWLNQYVGEHWVRWAWATDREHTSSEACVAFRWDKHRTLFLLTWS
jgi:hypothetical protein